MNYIKELASGVIQDTYRNMDMHGGILTGKGRKMLDLVFCISYTAGRDGMKEHPWAVDKSLTNEDVYKIREAAGGREQIGHFTEAARRIGEISRNHEWVNDAFERMVKSKDAESTAQCAPEPELVLD